jgi:hypothetical protein
MSEATTELTEYLQNNPRMMGVLFTAMLLLSQAGSVAATNAVGTTGP